MTTFATIALTDINPHPNNPRRHAVADDELVASIKAMGILTPVAVAPAASGYVLIGGHRRFDGATKAGLDVVPAVIREDLASEAAQLEAMLVENLHRVDLSPVEEADAYAQLALFGMKPDEIARATGRKASTVKARLKLKGLPEQARGRLHDGQITLSDAEALLEFADDPDTIADLEKALGTGNFAYRVQWTRQQAIEKQVAEAEALGAKPCEEWSSQVRRLAAFNSAALQGPAAHDGCLGYRTGYSSVELLCIQADTHDDPRPEVPADPAAAKREAEWQAQRAAQEAERERQRAASKVRLKSINAATARAFPASPEGLGLMHALMPMVLGDFDLSLPVEVMIDSAGLEVIEAEGTQPWRRGDVTVEAYRDTVAATYGEGHVAFIRWLSGVIETLLVDDGADPAHQVALWNWLEQSARHDMSEVDAELRDACEARLVEQEQEADQ